MSKPLYIMISSTRVDLSQYIERTRSILSQLKKENQGKWEIIETSMESAIQTGEREYPVALSKSWVEGAQWVILIVGWHYGTITNEDGVAGIGVTEWEYIHAVSLKKKKIFVFLAGNPETQSEYKPLPNEINLMSRFVQDTGDQRSKLEKFRQSLVGQNAGFFRNIDDFARQLEDSLRKAISNLIPPIPDGGGLAKVMIEVRPEFKACIKSVKCLASCKEIHDSLHILRQEVIKPLRGQVLEGWEMEGSLSRVNERTLANLRLDAGKLLAKIDADSKSLDQSRSVDLLEYLGKLLNAEAALNPFPDPGEESSVDISVFAEHLDIFAASAQRSFSEANKNMDLEKIAFDGLHDALWYRLVGAKYSQILTQDEFATLTDETGKMKDNKKRLVSAVTVHVAWQEVHDAMEVLQGLRLGSSAETQYIRKVREFLDGYGTKLKRLVENGLGPLGKDYLSDVTWDELLSRLSEVLSELSAGVDAEVFDRLRDAFDLCFFAVDKRTKALVKDIHTRVDEFDELLDRLGQSPEAPLLSTPVSSQQ